MITVNRVLGFICMWAACDRIFPPPEVPINKPTNKLQEIKTNSGRVKGYYMYSLNGNVIGAYEGIPYAESPVGQLRFRDPVPKKPWSDLLLADRRVTCIQMDPSRFYSVIGQEDCLVLNIYVPLERENQELKKIPVIVWIHGGSWHWSAGSHFGPSYLLDHNVILVTLNYRLGPLGFLSTGDSSSFGNYGLKDQSLALQWIVNNIEHFGGNSRQITLAGHSAGAASVHLHMMSPKSQGKFQRAISISGSALNFWAVQLNQTVLTNRVARSLGCASRNSLSVVNCLRRRSARRLVSKQYDLYELNENPSILFGPVVENGNPTGFLLDTPLELYRKGKVANISWITGITRDEGDLFTLVNYATPLAIRKLTRNLDTNIPIILGYNRTGTQETTKAIKSFYFGESPKFSFGAFEWLPSISQMVGDRYFYVPFHTSLETHSKYIKAPLYAYYFTFRGKHGIAEKLHLSPTEFGVMHMDDLQYMFNCSEYFPPIKRSDREYLISRYFTNLWTSFANIGEPVVVENEIKYDGWVPYSITNPKLLEINFNGEMVSVPYQHRIKFWNSIKNI